MSVQNNVRTEKYLKGKFHKGKMSERKYRNFYTFKKNPRNHFYNWNNFNKLRDFKKTRNMENTFLINFVISRKQEIIWKIISAKWI